MTLCPVMKYFFNILTSIKFCNTLSSHLSYKSFSAHFFVSFLPFTEQIHMIYSCECVLSVQLVFWRLPFSTLFLVSPPYMYVTPFSSFISSITTDMYVYTDSVCNQLSRVSLPHPQATHSFSVLHKKTPFFLVQH